MFQAYATAAAEACNLGIELAQRAATLTALAPKLRAKGSGDVIKLLLSDDAVPGSWLPVELAMAQVMGVLVSRYILRLEPLASASKDEVVAYLAPTIQRYLTP